MKKKQKKQVCDCKVRYFDVITKMMKCVNCGKLHEL